MPTGQVLFANGQQDIEVYTPYGGPRNEWNPTITECPTEFDLGGTYTLTGTQFNGLSQACMYGDDQQMATNYPLVLITSVTTGDRRYLRTFNHSTMAVATGPKPVSTQVTVPPDTPAGDYQLVVIANGIASDPVTVEVKRAAATDSPLPVTTRFDVQQLDAFWRGPDGTLWTGFADPNINNGQWQSFPIPGAAPAAAGSPVTALTRYGQQLDVFWIAQDGTVWSGFADPGIDNDTWHAFPST